VTLTTDSLSWFK